MIENRLIAPNPLYEVYIEKSNEILKKEKNSFDKNRVCYIWTGNNFDEDINCEILYSTD